MLSSSTTQDVLIRLACLGAAISLEAGLLFLAGRSLGANTIPQVMHKARWWHAHGRAVSLGGLVLVVVSAAALSVR